jgi:glycosyltransferase involved in cell wall biosynthesis
VALVHDEIGGETGMGRVARFIATTVLERDWELVVVASHVDTDLAAQARVVRVAFRHGLPALAGQVGWATAAARRVRDQRCDVVHVHSPQLIAVGDVMTCHHLLRPAHDHGVDPGGGRATGRLRDGQAWMRRSLDDRWYRGRRSRTRMTFVSEFLRDQFIAYYGQPHDGTVTPPPAPPWRPVSTDERAAARRHFGISGERVVVGYLGGDDLRKGIAAVRALDADAQDLELLVAGPRSEHLQLRGGHAVGFQPPDRVIAASDVVLAPALFDAAPVAVLQPLARGVPVVVGAATGWAPAVARHGAGTVWRPGHDLAELVRAAAAVPPSACRAFVEEISAEQVAERLLGVYRRAAPGLDR